MNKFRCLSQCSGSEMFIQDLGSRILIFFHPGSRFSYPRSLIQQEQKPRRKKICGPTCILSVAINFTKLKIILFLKERYGTVQLLKKNLNIFKVHPQNVRFQNLRFQNVRNVRFTKRQVYKTSGLQNVRSSKRNCYSALRNMGLGSEIQDLKYFISDPGVKKATDPVSGSATLV